MAGRERGDAEKIGKEEERAAGSRTEIGECATFKTDNYAR